MSISESLLPEFDQEMASTRKLLERLPENFEAGWKPHPKSMALGHLSGHVAELPSWATSTIEKDKLCFSMSEFKPFVPATRKEVLDRFDKCVAEARTAVSGATDEHLHKIWSLEVDGKTFMSMPRVAVLRGVVMNHLIHHRAQLGVYLRLQDIAIPGMYGPSADDPNPFASSQKA